jgi:hypothetical protein
VRPVEFLRKSDNTVRPILTEDLSSMRALCLLVAALALSGCGAHSSYSQLVAQSRAEYELAVLKGRGAPVAAYRVYASRAKARPRRAVAIETRPAADSRAARAAVTTGASRMDNPHPVGSAEWHAEWQRHDDNLKRRLNSICSTC